MENQWIRDLNMSRVPDDIINEEVTLRFDENFEAWPQVKERVIKHKVGLILYGKRDGLHPGFDNDIQREQEYARIDQMYEELVAEVVNHKTPPHKRDDILIRSTLLLGRAKVLYDEDPDDLNELLLQHITKTFTAYTGVEIEWEKDIPPNEIQLTVTNTQTTDNQTSEEVAKPPATKKVQVVYGDIPLKNIKVTLDNTKEPSEKSSNVDGEMGEVEQPPVDRSAANDQVEGGVKTLRCGRCLKPGHMRSECQAPRRVRVSRQRRGKKYVCKSGFKAVGDD